jgi:hypothetical protein
MTKEEIIEGNKLIAEFMGGKNLGRKGYTEYDYYSIEDRPKQEWTNTTGGSYEESDEYIVTSLEYRSSWDWLMPVVEKIEEQLNAPVHIWSDECKMKPFYDVEFHKDGGKGFSKINAVWLCVVEVIKWYNEQKQ